jgi:O-antigen/teichoic acid export membrane protein
VARSGGNLLKLGAAQLFRLGSGLAINLLLLRALGVDGFGVYGTVLTVVGLATFGAGMGMERLVNRELARDPSKTGRLVGAGMATTAGMSALTSLGVVAWVVLVDGRPVVIASGALAAFAMALQGIATVPQAAFHAQSDMGPSVKSQIAGRVSLVTGTVVGLLLGLDVAAVFVGQVLDGLVTLGTMLWMYGRHEGLRALRVRLEDARWIVRRSLPFGVNALFVSIYLSVDVLMLAVMRGDTDVGIYRGAVMLIALFPIIANTLTTGVYPRMAQHLGDREAAGAELGFVLRVLLTISVPSAVGGVLVAEPLMVLLGGPEFAVSAVPFMILVPLLPLRFANNAVEMTLTTLNRQRDRTLGAVIASTVNIGLNFLLIPEFGAAGAAATTLFTEVVLTLWLQWRVRPLVTGLDLLRTFGRVGVPAAAMAVALVLLPPAHVVVQIGVGVVVYGVVSRALGAWHPRDLGRLRRV